MLTIMTEIMLQIVAFGFERVVVFVWSRPGEFHPQPLAEPDVSLSTHPAPIKQTVGIGAIFTVIPITAMETAP